MADLLSMLMGAFGSGEDKRDALKKSLLGSLLFSMMGPSQTALPVMSDMPADLPHAETVSKASSLYNIDPKFVHAVIQAESGGNPGAVSPVGARGVMQLMPDTAKAMGVKNVHDPEQNIMGGVKYLSQLLEMFGGNKELAAAAYNAGPGNVRKYGNIVPPFKETKNYLQKIRKLYGPLAANEPERPGPGDETDFGLTNTLYRAFA